MAAPQSLDDQDRKFEYLLRLGDSTLVLAQRLSEWVGRAPALEEDMALANTALDLLGQARMWLTYAGEVEGRGRDENQLAYLRDAHAFRNALLVELPNEDYSDTLARQYLFDSWHLLLLQALSGSGDEHMAAIAEKALKEVTYHLRRSRDLVVRLGDGSDESRRRLQNSFNDLWMYTGELFEVDEVDRLPHGHARSADASTLRERWLEELHDTFAHATLALPDPDAWMQRGGKQGRHTEHMGYLLAEMQFLQRAYPGARW
ncbi:MAG: 1,2-phenylacetyl-CoA epoxidase subunit PaaC [Pseudomonadota bacterium]